MERECADSPATTILDSDSDSDDGINPDDDVLYNLLMHPSTAVGQHSGNDGQNYTCRSPFKQKLEPLPEIEVDEQELMERYPLNDPNNENVFYSPKKASRIVLSNETFALSPCNLDNKKAGPTKPLQIIAMSLADKRVAMSQMVEDMPYQIQYEAECRLRYVINNPAILLMYNKCRLSFISRAVDLRREFYIGITERPRERFEEHFSRFSQMALWIFEDSRCSAAAEKSLIQHFRDCSLMLNVGGGGERRSAAKPHFLYIALKRLRK